LATAIFRTGGVLWSAVGCVPAGWQRDALGREGALLVHGVFTPVAEGSAPGAAVHAVALLELLQGMAVAPADGLEAYLGACDRTLESERPAPDPVALVNGMDAAELSGFLAEAACGTLAREAVPGQEYEAALAVARATAALPPRIRGALRWSIGLLPNDPAGTSAPALPPAAPGVAQRYHAWLRRAIAAGRDDALECVLRDWETARSWQTLIRWVDPN
jgi:hypothetical protein